ncbi:MAG: carbamoyltransferase HypF [Gammaproteobacteria bacterium]|nr:carbamoyltransferase HypF [Gammaproteobacteria bacterium]
MTAQSAQTAAQIVEPIHANTSRERNLTTHTLRVRGLVQGVGFRPTVWRLANELGLTGDVRNDGEGVLINLLSTADTTEIFTKKLFDECPPLARIDSIEQIPNTDEITHNNFQIIESAQTEVATGVIADAATCADCQQELFDATDRRFSYPFLNCTHCGPRFSIVRQIPYDRANTSMSTFKLCDDCLSEYQNPADRRFHAQPTACEKCGPKVWLCDTKGETITSTSPIADAAKQLKQGAIVAIKGIGGIHLACDASNAKAVETLRQRKKRPHKPLALMARNVEQVHHYCHVNTLESETLSSPAAPIVILDMNDTERLPIDRLPAGIAPGQKQLGFMLPYSPLHHLLMAELEHPIVLTSGNRSDEPQCIDNDDAIKRLSNIADIFLLHNRPIENRIDDSVVRQINGKIQVMRRARGYAPGHIKLPAGFKHHPPILALGGELKSTFCLLKNGHAILSQHMGDLEDARTFDDYQKNIALYQNLYAFEADVVVADNHPEYLSTKLGVELTDSARTNKQQKSLIQVQHHHAHIAACMLDNNIDLDEGSVIGIAFDGLGFGDDGTLWGGEFLLADYQNYQRLAHLKPVVMPGGSQAMREPWRNTWSQLQSAFGWDAFTQQYSALELSKTLNSKPVKTLQQMINKGINSPLTSSAGRLFDAVAAATGLAPPQCSFEGQAAMALENSIDKASLEQASPYQFKLNKQENHYQLDPTPLWISLLNDLTTNTTASIIAARFHRGLAQAIIDTANLLASENKISRIALSGGVFQNRTLFELVVAGLEEANLQVLTHHQVPANDGGLALGQAAIAAARAINFRAQA